MLFIAVTNRTSKFLKLILVVMLFWWLSLIACGVDGDRASDVAPSPESVAVAQNTVPPPKFKAPSPSLVANAPNAVASAMLVLGDLPPQWSGSPAPGRNTDLVLSESCETVWPPISNFVDRDGFPGKILGDESDTFTGPNGQTINTGVAVFPSADAAEYSLTQYDRVMTLCRNELASAFKELVWKFTIRVAPGLGDRKLFDEINHVFVRDIAYPELGDTSNSYRLQVEQEFETLKSGTALDLILIQDGKMLAAFSYTRDIRLISDEKYDEEELMLLRLLEAKLSKADDSLPD